MVNKHIVIALIVAVVSVVSITAVHAYGSYPTRNAFSYQQYAQPSQSGYMYGYGQGYTYNGIRMSPYNSVDGYRLTDTGPYPYPPNSRFVSSTQFRGHFDPWTNRYYDAWNGRTVSQQPRVSGGVPAVNYPRNNQIVNRQSYW